MKMRKILPLVILSVGALVLLSGCDAMLDAIFPTAQISVDAAVSGASHPQDWNATYRFGYNSGSVTVTVVDQNTDQTYQATSTWNYADVNYIYYHEISFTGLKDHTFLVTASYTSLYDGIPGTYSTYVDTQGAKGHSANVQITF